MDMGCATPQQKLRGRHKYILRDFKPLIRLFEVPAILKKAKSPWFCCHVLLGYISESRYFKLGNSEQVALVYRPHTEHLPTTRLTILFMSRWSSKCRVDSAERFGQFVVPSLPA